jgi:hypothetical protein
MNNYTDKGYTAVAVAAITKYQRVKLTAANTVNVAGDEETAIGVAMENVASGDPVGIKLLNDGGVIPVVAAGAITAATSVYGAASGRVEGSGTTAIGSAIEAATAAGQVIGMIPV